MSKIKVTVFMLVLLCFAGVMFAQNSNVIFNATTNATYLRLNEEYPGGSYPRGAVAGRWIVQFYKSTDATIDPLGADGLPTGDDEVLNNQNNSQLATIQATPPTVYTFTVGAAVIFPPSATTINGLQGDKVYGRIFNSDTIATATKYVQFNAMYTVTTGLNQTCNIQTALSGWSEWTTFVAPPADWTISGTITTATGTLDGVSIAATGIAAGDIVYTAATGVYTITVPNAWNGTITPTKAGAQFTPANRSYTNVTANVTGDNFVLKTVVAPGAPMNLSPNAETLDFPVATAVTLEWDAPAAGTVEGYKLVWNGAAPVALGATVTEWTTPALGAGDYTWSVVAYNEGTYSKSGNYIPVNARAKANDRAVVSSPKADSPLAAASFTVTITPPVVYTITLTSNPAGAMIYKGAVELGVAPQVINPAEAGTYTAMLEGYTFVEYVVAGPFTENLNHEFVGTPVVVTPDYPNGTAVDVVVGGETVTIMVTVGTGMDDTPAGVLPGWPNPDQVPAFVTVGWFNGTGTITFVIATTAPWGGAYFGGMWHSFQNLLGHITFVIDFDAKAPVPIILGPVDPTLPVELSAFNAILTAQNFVKLSWISESETNMLGYRVYRSETAEQASALMITPIMIQATNTSSTATYSMEDREVFSGNTYYYWLEAVDFGHSQFFGPQSVIVTADVTPELPVQSALKNAYPNPFKANSNTTIEVAVKAGETGTVTVYNVLGQAVKTFSVSEGSHNLKWNGRDSKNNICGSGIYFYKLSTPSMNQTKKMVIVK